MMEIAAFAGAQGTSFIDSNSVTRSYGFLTSPPRIVTIFPGRLCRRKFIWSPTTRCFRDSGLSRNCFSIIRPRISPWPWYSAFVRFSRYSAGWFILFFCYSLPGSRRSVKSSINASPAIDIAYPPRLLVRYPEFPNYNHTECDRPTPDWVPLRAGFTLDTFRLKASLFARSR